MNKSDQRAIELLAERVLRGESEEGVQAVILGIEDGQIAPLNMSEPSSEMDAIKYLADSGYVIPSSVQIDRGPESIWNDYKEYIEGQYNLNIDDIHNTGRDVLYNPSKQSIGIIVPANHSVY